MNQLEFEKVFNEQMRICHNTLVLKAAEYADDNDRLHNFQVAAALQGANRREALAGMMAKHTVSIYDMCAYEGLMPLTAWEEKITDHMNYLILLLAIVREDHAEQHGYGMEDLA